MRMTLHTALQRTTLYSPVARVLARKAHGIAANDNTMPGAVSDCEDPQLFNASVRFFGEHGLGAAREARKLAEAAFFADDRAGYDYWLGICRTLDKRLALQTDKTMATRLETPIG